jgi:hypothetical protein
MPGSVILKGQARRSLVKETAISVIGSSGLSLGVHDVGLFSRLGGMVSIIGSGRLAYSMGIDSATMLVSSSFIVSSGPSTFDFLNYGHSVGISFSQLSSQANAKVLIMGESIR